MYIRQKFLESLWRMGSMVRKRVDNSLSHSGGGWWIPSMVACVVWVWLSNREKKPA